MRPTQPRATERDAPCPREQRDRGLDLAPPMTVTRDMSFSPDQQDRRPDPAPVVRLPSERNRSRCHRAWPRDPMAPPPVPRTCVNCTLPSHTVRECVSPKMDGFVHGCPLCNLPHTFEKCALRAKSIDEDYQILVVETSRPPTAQGLVDRLARKMAEDGPSDAAGTAVEYRLLEGRRRTSYPRFRSQHIRLQGRTDTRAAA
ncbi:hypothetical protein QBC47DRAFT_89733 [Echria macrotheca]|uniref:Uncharacterized protein n=1 Tax=Echria macrotheca TaxID=438768 RepID=A0AAJ0B7S0_9PEZI|nr:hypothetical protein QBC47DRAFT_89733 [Echria macrotheca]